jgi:hypothetical protein
LKLNVKKLIHIILFFAVIFLAGVSGATASTFHDHYEGISNSPFQGKSNSHSLHCQLNKHFGQTCPHARAQGDTMDFRLAVDCDGNPNVAVPAVPGSGNNQFLFFSNFHAPSLNSPESIFISADIFLQFYSNPVEHPPKAS